MVAIFGQFPANFRYSGALVVVMVGVVVVVVVGVVVVVVVALVVVADALVVMVMAIIRVAIINRRIDIFKLWF